jgi:SagB-type dehydrogenase family enzyme
MPKNQRLIVKIALIISLSLAGLASACSSQPNSDPYTPGSGNTIALPEPRSDSDTSVESALLNRRSIREYRDEPLALAEVSQLLWAAQGITHPNGYRTAPSAGALYPLEVYLLAGNVSDLPQGVYRYLPGENALAQVLTGDHRQALCEAALNQSAVQDAAAVLVIAAVYERTTVKYGQRGHQYVHMEVGSAAQNVYLQAVALDLGSVFIGAFHDEVVKSVLQLGDDEVPLGIMPVGKK